MAKAFLLEPEAALARVRRRYRNQARAWLSGGGEWPLAVPLGTPNEREALARLTEVRTWQAAWTRWQGPGEIEWVERQWPTVGAQRLPRRLVLATPVAAAEAIGEDQSWRRASERFKALVAEWPALADLLPRYFDMLAEWAEADFDRLRDLLRWLRAHPDSDLYPRQLPVAGLDSKWLEAHQSVVGEWLRASRGEADGVDLFELAGLRLPPLLLRVRLLDPELRERAGRLRDITAPVADLAQLRLPLRKVFIVENLQTGLAFADLPGALVLMAQGYAIDLFGQLPWLATVACYYWGDLDTHGFAILNRLRQYVPHARSLLMDEKTLLDHRDLWGEEDRPAAAAELPRLTDAEQGLYDQLRCDHWQPRVRLEQERIAWDYAWRKLSSV